VLLKILVPARSEIEEATAWYDAQAPGLGSKFRQELIHGLKRVRDFPRAWHPVRGKIRRYRLARFPYGILYAIEGEEILVLAIAHLHRHPQRWRDRFPA